MGEKISKILKGEITSSVFYILFGLCLVCMPAQTVGILCKVVFGLVLIGAGIYHVLIYVAGKANSTILDLLTGVIVLVLGGFLFFNPQIVIKLLPLLLGATSPKALPILAYIQYIHPDLRHRPYAMALNGIIIMISLLCAVAYFILMKKNIKGLSDKK